MEKLLEKDQYPLLFTLVDKSLPYATHHLADEVPATLDSLGSDEKIVRYLKTSCTYTVARLWSVCYNQQISSRNTIEHFGSAAARSERYREDIVEYMETNGAMIIIGFCWGYWSGEYYIKHGHVYAFANYKGTKYLLESSLGELETRVHEVTSDEIRKKVKHTQVNCDDIYIRVRFGDVPSDEKLHENFEQLKAAKPDDKYRKILLENP